MVIFNGRIYKACLKLNNLLIDVFRVVTSKMYDNRKILRKEKLKVCNVIVWASVV